MSKETKETMSVDYPFGTVSVTTETHKSDTSNPAPVHSHISIDNKRIDVHHQPVDVNNPNKNK